MHDHTKFITTITMDACLDRSVAHHQMMEIDERSDDDAQVDVELEDGVLALPAGRPPEHVAGGHAEPPRDVVPAHHRDGAAGGVARVVGEHDVHGEQHRWAALLQRRGDVGALRAPHRPGRAAGALRRHVVDHHRVAEGIGNRMV